MAVRDEEVHLFKHFIYAEEQEAFQNEDPEGARGNNQGIFQFYKMY